MADESEDWTRKDLWDLVPGRIYDRILNRMRENAADRMADYSDPHQGAGDTPIERLLIAALRAEVDFGAHEHTHIHLLPRGEGISSEHFDKVRSHGLPLIVESQVEITGHRLDISPWRADFVIWTPVCGGMPPAALVVECDGHDFHERTKEQAARDRARDRDAQLIGHSLFRFTGSEIHRDPIKCALRILDWAVGRSCL